MPATFIAELILQPILELVYYTGGYYVGCLVVPVISLGRWKCDPLLRDVQQVFHRPGQNSVGGRISRPA
jgi:hypothetical protein